MPRAKVLKGTVRSVEPKRTKKPMIQWDDLTIAKLLKAEPDLQFADSPAKARQLILRAQKVLPEEQRRTGSSISGSLCKPGIWASQLTKGLAAMHLLEPEKKGDGKHHSYARSDLAILAYDEDIHAMLMADALPDNTRLLDALMQAQSRHFPREKWRPRASMQNAIYNKLVERMRQYGLALPNPHAARQAEQAEAELRRLEAEREQLAQQAAAQSTPVPEAAPVQAPAKAPTVGQAFMDLLAALKPVVATLSPLAAGLADAWAPKIEDAVARGIVRGMERVQAPERHAQAMANHLDVAQMKQTVRDTIVELLGSTSPQPDAERDDDPPHAQINGMDLPERKPRVDVVGLLGDQEQVVRSKCGRDFDLRFIGANEVERKPITAPTAIMLTKFVKHSAQDRIKKSGANLVFANGGADSVVNHLQSMTMN